MRKGGGKSKGSGFEREIAKELSLWMTNGQRNDLFWRTHSSGALGTIGNRKMEYGDIMAIDDLGKPLTDNYHIECRCGKIIRLRDLAFGRGNIVDFIKQGRQGAKDSGRQPLWFFREHMMPTVAMFEMEIDGVHSYPEGLIYFSLFGVGVTLFETWKKEFCIDGNCLILRNK